jgi:hypothetical protein
MFYYETSGNPAYLSKRLKNSIRILFLFNFHPSLSPAQWARFSGKVTPPMTWYTRGEMRLIKNRPKCGPTYFVPQIIHNFFSA